MVWHPASTVRAVGRAPCLEFAGRFVRFSLSALSLRTGELFGEIWLGSSVAPSAEITKRGEPSWERRPHQAVLPIDPIIVVNSTVHVVPSLKKQGRVWSYATPPILAISSRLRVKRPE